MPEFLAVAILVYLVALGVWLLLQDICVFVWGGLRRRGLLCVVQCLLERRAFRGHASVRPCRPF